ncbi:hypothetical protein [Altererythrobacter sp. Root672]|uniref:hypothetical protein n=1 Tax=Altererythrobacter sp. Root672 TaxID=1736584 RepID=UPI0012E34864|nr:hypothetical protein [Altererythrobacter sp. Root672]
MHAETSPFPAQARVTDEELDGMRGGFVLPNGMDVAVGIDIQTLVNGALALRTVLNTADTGLPLVFTGTGGATSAAADEGTVTTVPGVGVVRVVDGPAPPAEAGSGQQQIELTPNGPAVQTAAGSVQLAKDETGSIVVLSGNSLELRHIIGNFTGTLIANTANDRSIDTVVTLNIDLRNSAVPVGNAMLRWESVAADIVGRSVR